MSDCGSGHQGGTIRAMTRILALVLIAATMAAPVDALAARADDDDVRVAGRCSRASDATLRLRTDDDSIRVELRIDTNRAGASWRVVLLHDRRLAYRKTLRTGASSRSLRVRHELPNWFGRDTVVVRATGPGGETCRASATM
jgi:hypothetical protein